MKIDLTLKNPIEIKREIGQYVKVSRKLKKIGTLKLARQLNMAENTIIKIERGDENYTIDNLLTILKAIQ